MKDIFDSNNLTWHSKLFVLVSTNQQYPFDNPNKIKAVSKALKVSDMLDISTSLINFTALSPEVISE